MRYIILTIILLVLCCFTAQAQDDNKGPLQISNSLISIKVSNPEQQITKFASVLSILDKITAGKNIQGKDVPTSITSSFNTLLGMLKMVPGVKVDGNFWILIMPPVPGEESNGGSTPSTPISPTPPGTDNTQIPSGAPKKTQNLLPTYLILPLVDGDAFQAYLDAEAKKDPEKAPHATIFGEYALMVFKGPLPAYSDVDFDLKMVSKCDIEASFQFANVDLSETGEYRAMLSKQIPTQLIDYFARQQDNIQRIECGLAMDDTNIILKFYLVPVVGSKLDDDIPHLSCSFLKQYAEYLPAVVSYANVSGPLAEGAPGTAYSFQKIGSTFLQTMLGDQASIMDNFMTSLTELTKMCCQGRALALIAPATRTGDLSMDLPTLVAVYRTSTDVPKASDKETAAARQIRIKKETYAETESRAIIRVFVSEAVSLNENFQKNGMAFMYIAPKPEAEKIDDRPIDLVKIKFVIPTLSKQPAPNSTTSSDDSTIKPEVETPEKPPKTASVEIRIAYFKDKLLVTAGPGSKIQMANLLARLKGAQPGLTQSARYIASRINLSRRHALEIYSTQDLTRMMACLLPYDPEVKSLFAWLKAYPPLFSWVTMTQEGDNTEKCLRYDVRLSLEQIRYLLSLLKKTLEPTAVKVM